MEAISNCLKNNPVFAFNTAKQQEQVQEKAEPHAILQIVSAHEL
jgi:hypothetical protein